MREEHPEYDTLAQLALDDMGTEERAEVLSHLTGCEQCRDEYDHLAAAVERTLAAVPSVEPAPGFEQRALEAMGVAARPPHRRFTARVLVAAAVTGLALGAGATVAVQELGDSRPPAVVVAGADLMTGDGDRVGAVTRVHSDASRLVVVITDGPPGMRYECVLVLSDGTRRPMGVWEVDDDRGGVWQVAATDGSVASVELVTDSGDVWATARL